MPKKSFFIYSLLFVAVSFSLAATAALIPSIADEFAVAKQQAVWLTWLYMLPYSVVAFAWGPLSRSMTIRRLLLIASAGFFCATLLLALSSTINQAYVFRFLMGCFASAFIPLSFITVGKAVSSKNKAKCLGAFFALSSIASCTGVFLSGFLSWRLIYLIPALLSLAIFILVFFCLEEFDFRREKFSISYGRTLRDRQALKFFLVIAVGSFLFHGLQQNMGVYLSEYLSWQQSAISFIFTASAAAAIAFRFLGGVLASSLGNVSITRLGLFGMSIFAVILIIAKSAGPLFFLVILWGGGWAMAHVGLSAYLTEMPDKVLRDASSINSFLRMGFGGLGAFFAGLLSFSIAGFRAVFVMVAAICLILGISLHKLLIVKRSEGYG